jgi:hypothetical protein
MWQKIKVFFKLMRAEKYMLITPKDKTSVDVETTFDARDYSRSGNALYFNFRHGK